MADEDRDRDQTADAGTEAVTAVGPAPRMELGRVFRIAGVATVAALVVLLAGYGVYVVRHVLVLVLVGLFVAISLEPVVRWLTRKGLNRSLAVAVVILALVVLFGIFVWSFLPPMLDQGGRLFHDLPGSLQRFSAKWKPVREVTDRYHLTGRLTDLVGRIPGALAGGAVGFLQRVLGTLASGLTVLVLAIYFMAAMPRVQRGLVRLFPPVRRPRVATVTELVVQKVGGYMIGNLIISLFAGVSTYICLRLLGVPFALPLATTVAITDLIPMIGATLGAVICVGVAVFTVDIWPAGVVLLLFFIGYQQLENYLIAPRVMRDTVDMSAVAVLLVALVGGTLLGLVGAIMAIPLAAAVKVILSPAVDRMYDSGDSAQAEKAPAEKARSAE